MGVGGMIVLLRGSGTAKGSVAGREPSTDTMVTRGILVSATVVGFGVAGAAAGEGSRASTDTMVTRGIFVSVVAGDFGAAVVTVGLGAVGTGCTVGTGGVGLAVVGHAVQGVDGGHVVHGLAVVVQVGVHVVELAQLLSHFAAAGRRYGRSRLHEEQEVHSRVRWAQANTSAELSKRVPNLTGSGTRRMCDPH